MREVRVERDLPPVPRVAASVARLAQVLVNLLLNAADAMDGAGCVRVSALDAGDTVELRVSDDGPGVPPELRDRLFEPFVTGKEPGLGTGLGLAISRSIVEGYGGTIALDPTTARGATFVVRLRRYTPPARPSAPM
jgi:signal transduction histidine kinase